MDDEDVELKDFTTKIKILVFIFVVFGSLLTIIFINKFGAKTISVNKQIDKYETLYVLVINNKTKNTKAIKKELKDTDEKYVVVNRDREHQFDSFLKKIDITEQDIVEPTVIYVENKKASVILVDIKNIDDLKSFLKYNSESGKER